ncbi:class I SAM-dependent methyltransferase [Saccharothrix stipae]
MGETDHAAFIRSVTTPRPVPLTPGIALHTADDVIALWQRTGSPEPPFWAFPWAGGQALARYVLDHPDLVTRRHVLDLASGSGLVAVAAARAGGLVTANDVDPVAATAIALNARANDVTLTITPGDLLDTTPDTDVLLAGDVFYDRDMAARVEPFLLAAHRRGTLVLVGDPSRSFMPRGWTRVDAFPVPVPPDLEGVTVRTTTVWRP